MILTKEISNCLTELRVFGIEAKMLVAGGNGQGQAGGLRVQS